MKKVFQVSSYDELSDKCVYHYIELTLLGRNFKSLNLILKKEEAVSK